MDINSPEFQALFLRDAKAKAGAGQPITIEMSFSQALTIVGQLQLALRHPGNRGPSFKETLHFTRRLLDAVATTEILRAGLEAGFDPQWDVEREGGDGK
jgi:hypothetical protein